MKNLFLIICYLSSYCLFAQNEFAFAGPQGVFVYLGKAIPNGNITESISLYRKSEENDFKEIVKVNSVKTEMEFIDRAKEYSKYFIDFHFPADSILQKIWARSIRYNVVDSLGSWGTHPAIGMALGVIYYDQQVDENVPYQYKVNNIFSNEVIYPIQIVQDEVFLQSYVYKANGELNLRFYSVGKNLLSGFKLFKYNNEIKPEEVEGERTTYRSKDTTFYVITDKKLAGLRSCQYSLIGVDKFGNMTQGCDPIIIKLNEFSTTYFVTTQAKRLDGELGIRLSWQMSNKASLESINIFRSDNYDSGFEKIGTVASWDSTFIDQNIMPDRLYYYYLETKDFNIEKSKRSARFFAFGYDYNRPLQPTINYAIPLTNGVKLDVLIPDEFVVGYRVLRSENGSRDFSIINSLVKVNKGDKIMTFYDTSSVMNSRIFYNYVIESINSSNKVSERSNMVQCRPNKNTNVMVPRSVNIYFQDSLIHLSWENIMNEDVFVAGYQVYKKKGTDDFFEPVFSENQINTKNYYTDEVYERGENYEYQIEAIDIAGYPSLSRISGHIKIPNSVIPEPVVLSVLSLSDGVRIEWSKPNDSSIQNYDIYRYQRGQEPVKIGLVESSIESYLDINVQEGQLYFYMIKAIGKQGIESDFSDEVGIRL